MGNIAAITCATTANLVGTYSAGAINNTTFTVTATGVLVIDGHTTVLNDLVLFKDQTTAFQNGIYQVTTAGAGGIQPVFTRVSNYWNPYEINGFGLINITLGTSNAFTTWGLTANITTLGVDSINYALSYKQYGTTGSQYVYVDANGSDTTGTGTQVAPYATVSHAESVITTATATSPFTIYINGTIVDTAISKKPFINWQGVDRNSSYVKFNTFVADASMSAAGSYCSFTSLTFTSRIANPLVLDLSASGFSVTATFSSCQLNPACQFIGPTGAIFLVNIKNGTNVTGTIAATDVTMSTITTSFLSAVTVTASTRSAAWTSNADTILDFTIDGGHGFACSGSMPTSTATFIANQTVTGANGSLTYGPVINPANITVSSGATITPAFIIGASVDTVYVDTSAGSDTFGNGTAFFPYATIAKAYSSISLNTAARPFVVMFMGTTTIASLSLNPFISLRGYGIFNSQITINGGDHRLHLSAAFIAATSPTSSVSDIYFINNTGMALITTGGAGTNATINVERCTFSIASNIQGRGATTDTINITNCIFNNTFTAQDFNCNSTFNQYQGAVTYTIANAGGNNNYLSIGDVLSSTLSSTNTAGHVVTYQAYAGRIASTVALDGVGFTYDATTSPTTVTLANTASTTASSVSSYRTIGTNTYTGATYTFVYNDQGNFIQFNRATAQTVTVATNATTAFPIGTEIDCIQIGVGQVTFAAAGGVTINSKTSGLSLSAQYSKATLKKTGTDTWDLYGDLSGGQIVTVTAVTGATYTTLATDYFITVNRAGTVAITLITSPVKGTSYRIKDISGAASTNNITITPAAGNIDGTSNYVINANYASVDLIYNGTTWSIL